MDTAASAPPAHARTDCAAPPADDPWSLVDMRAFAAVAQAWGGLSPAALALALQDWTLHLGNSPGTQWAMLRAMLGLDDAPPPAAAAKDDPRFRHPEWDAWPLREARAQFQRCQNALQRAVGEMQGLSPHHRHVMAFLGRQWLDLLSPSTCPWIDPEVRQATLASGGRNLVEGALRLRQDAVDLLAGHPPGASPASCAAYVVGRNIAVTPGKVVYRNPLFELIQYAPATGTVRREPVLIAPSWILKYYVLDLSPRNSLVRALLQAGHTVFAMSWRNPGAELGGLSLDDYLHGGLLQALAQASRLCGGAPVHAAGYCLGGTLLAIAAAYLARQPHQGPPLASATLIAAQTDFSQPGELGLFIDTSAVAYLKALMRQQGYLDGRQLAGVFQLLSARDLVWSRTMRGYLLGRPARVSDLMSWNADVTRVPYRMHGETLERLYLENQLAAGRYCVDGRPVALTDVRVPVFLVATERDHISPWRSVHALHLLADTDVTFALVSGGHNTGIVADPVADADRHHYRLHHHAHGEPYAGPDEWLAQNAPHPGLWWPAWHDWLARHSGAQTVAAARRQAPAQLPDAPGAYVLEK